MSIDGEEMPTIKRSGKMMIEKVPIVEEEDEWESVPHTDIDVGDETDPQLCCVYVNDIYSYLRENEVCSFFIFCVSSREFLRAPFSFLMRSFSLPPPLFCPSVATWILSCYVLVKYPANSFFAQKLLFTPPSPTSLHPCPIFHPPFILSPHVYNIVMVSSRILVPGTPFTHFFVYGSLFSPTSSSHFLLGLLICAPG